MDIDPAVQRWLLGSGFGGVALFVLARYGPGFLTLFKRESLDQTTLDAQKHAVESLDNRLERKDLLLAEKEALVEKLQILKTRMKTLLIRLSAHFDKESLPKDLREEYDDLTGDK